MHLKSFFPVVSLRLISKRAIDFLEAIVNFDKGKNLGFIKFRTITQKGLYKKSGQILVIAALILFSNVVHLWGVSGPSFIWLDSESSINVAKSIDIYTPHINENETALKTAVLGIEEGFLHKPLTSDEISSDLRYVVMEGDTVSTIAQKFDVNVATIQSVNNLNSLEMDKIKPGTTLVIPPYNTENSLAWLDEINEEKQKIAEAEAKKREAEKAKLARQKRTVAYRDQSSVRETTSGYDGEPIQMDFIMPINHNGISRGITSYHTGIDYRADTGTPVLAAQSGKVVESTDGWGRGWGKSLVIDHGGGITTRYAHLSSFSVSVGSYIKQGQIIGYSGNSGLSTGPHLHYEAKKNGRVINPNNL